MQAAAVAALTAAALAVAPAAQAAQEAMLLAAVRALSSKLALGCCCAVKQARAAIGVACYRCMHMLFVWHRVRQLHVDTS